MTTAEAFVQHCRERIAGITPFRVAGCVRSLVGNVVEAEGVAGELGALARIEPRNAAAVMAEVVGFREGSCLLMPLMDPVGVAPGTRVSLVAGAEGAPDARSALGRVIDGLGRPLDGGPRLGMRRGGAPVSGDRPVLSRRPVDAPLDVGVRAINALFTVGVGSRIGLFAGSGVGKSTLLGQIARFAQADAIVVGLIGERGREVREFVERELGGALDRSVVVVSTSDEAPVLRRRAADLATSVAEQLRDEGARVLLLMDSLSRFCAAQREIGLAAGEPPATRGYPPSVWSAVARLVERAGTSQGNGNITGIYTVLVEGDDPEDPVADAVRSLIDGHIVLSRKQAERGHFPAIDPLASVSRVMSGLLPPDALARAARTRQILSTHTDAEDLLAIGAYQAGVDSQLDEAVRLEPGLRRFLAQHRDERAAVDSSLDALGVALEAGAS